MSKGIKKTHEEFVKEVNEKFKGDYTVIGLYINNKTDVMVRHNVCGHEYTVRPYSILSGHGCPKCKGTPRKSHEEFVKEIYDLVGDEYTVLGQYRTCDRKVLMKHNVCGHEWEVKPATFLHGTRCPICQKIKSVEKITKSHEEFVKEVYDLVGDEYTVLSDYVNSNTKVILRHNECGHEWEVPPNRFLSGARCPKCCSYHIYLYDDKESMEDLFKKKVYELTGNEYTVLGKYINSREKILMRHNECGHEWKISPTNFIKGQRCPKCKNTKTKHTGIKLTDAEFRKRVHDLVGDEYTVLGEYVNSCTKIKMKHNVCGKEFEVEPRVFLLYYNSIMSGDKTKVGSRCPHCANKNRHNQYLDIVKAECNYHLKGEM